MKAYFKLLRVPNVLMVGVTMLLMRYAVIDPMLSFYVMELKLPLWAFAAYLLATMLVTAAGYVINDYYDRGLDLINRTPGNVVVDQSIPGEKVISIYRVLNIAAVILAGIASYKTGVFWLVICYPIMIGLLYFYSTTYKKQLLLGNIIVALASSLVPVAVYLYELPPVISHYKHYILSASLDMNVIGWWILGFSLFAFVSGLAREIIKDMEDYEGDRIYGRNTVPIVWGIKWAKGISMGLIFLMIAAIALIYIFVFMQGVNHDYITLVYFSVLLIFPMCYNIYRLYIADSVAGYKFSGDLLKWIMLAGILYSLVVFYIINKNT